MNSILFGIMVALAVSSYFYASIGYARQLGPAAPMFLLVATICTGIAAGMVYGGGV